MDARTEYKIRINRVLDYVHDNLDADLSLKTLARVANFSPYHFHRIFSALIGETCHQLVRRLRVERAAQKLVYNPNESITAIALDCGFSSPETFARTFKDVFGMSASEWRTGGSEAHRKNRKVDRKGHQSLRNPGQVVSFQRRQDADGHVNWRLVMKNHKAIETEIHVKTLEPTHVVYLRHIGPYAGNAALFGELFGRLAQWAGPRGLLATGQFLSVYHDDPNVTDEAKHQLSVCVTCPKGTEVSGEIGEMTIPGGAYAVAHFEIDVDQYADAWDAVYGQWLPESGYQPDDRPSFERYLNNPQEHPEQKHIVELNVPVKPL